MKELPKRDIPLGSFYLALSFFFIGCIYNTAYNNLTSLWFLLFWVILYHGFWMYLKESLIRFFPELLKNDE